MDISQITTASDFRDFMRSVLLERAKTYQGSLEEYLRALWAVIQEYQDSPPSFALFAGILAGAFTKEPSAFNEDWLSYQSPPKNLILGNHATIKSDYECLQQIILYQIADLHRMTQVGTINHPYRYFGIDSPTGYRWYNFDPEVFLECASGYPLWEKPTLSECTWATLALFLWLGQTYE